MATEADFMRRCMKRATELGARLWRLNVGLAWTGEVTKNRDGSITIKNPRPFKSGIAGMSDLIGFVPVEITEQHLGQTLAVYAAVETKSPRGRPTDEQRAFVAMVQRFGGRAGICRTDEDLTTILLPSPLLAQDVVKKATHDND